MIQDWPRVGQYVDFKGSGQVWEVGLVLAKSEQCIKIRSEGWGQRYDELVPLTDDTALNQHSRIQPFHTIIRGYTGVKKTPSPREHWKFTREDHQHRIQKLDSFVVGLEDQSSQDLVQYLRGQHYFYVDFLMGNIYTEIQDLTKVYQYFLQHINLLHLFITRLLEKGLPTTFLNQSLEAPASPSRACLWNINMDNCYYELIDAMYNIAGLQERLSFFLRHNEDLIKEVVGECEKHEHYISVQVQNVKLYEAINELIVHTHAVVTKKEASLPFAFFFSLFQLFQVNEPIFKLEKLMKKGGEMFRLLFELLVKAFEDIQPNDMKQVQIDRQIEHILFCIRYTAAKYDQEQLLGRWCEEMRMSTCQWLLRCDKLQKKIRGISRLREIADHTMKDSFANFSMQTFAEMLQSLKIFQELFMENEHTQIYKKSTELVSILYKYDIITVEELCYVWNTSINKHPMIVTQLYQFWIEMAYVLQYEDINKYAQTATAKEVDINSGKDENGEYFLFFLDLVIAIINNNVKSDDKKNEVTVHENIDKMLEQMINIAYQMLLTSFGQPYFSTLVTKYGTVVMESRYCEQLIKETYHRLVEQEQLQVCLEILHEVYGTFDRTDVYVPEDIRVRLIECMRNPLVTVNEIGYIFQIINSIITSSNSHNLTNKEFEILWEFFQRSSQDFRQEFYTWILPLKIDEIHDTITSHINLGFDHDLKKFILNDIISSQQYLRYNSLTKKELSIILQLFIQVNTFEGRVEKKKIHEGYRFLSRIKTVQLLNEGLLWVIFEQCRSDDVIQYLNRYLIKFYFFFSPSLAPQLKKGRMDDIMEKIMANIKGGYSRGNFRLVKHSLELLKGIFELVKEDDRFCYQSDNPSPYKVKVEVHYLGSSYRFDISESESVIFLKYRIAERLKLKVSSFRMVAKEEQNSEELDYSFKLVAIGLLRKCQVQIVDIPREQETTCKFVSGFISEQMETILIDMLQNEMVASQVFMLLDELDLKLDKMVMLAKINSILQKNHNNEGTTTMAMVEIYYHLLEIKIFQKMVEKEGEIESFIGLSSFGRMLRCMRCEVTSDYQINFLFKFISLIIRVIKKAEKMTVVALNLPEYFFSTIFELSEFLLKAKGVGHNTKDLVIKIIDNSCTIIEYLVGYQAIVGFYAGQAHFGKLIENVYLNNQIDYIRMLITDKLGKYLTPISTEEGKFDEEVQGRLLLLFVDQLYFKVKQKELEGDQADNESVFDFCSILAKIVAFIPADRLEQTQILKPIEGREVSLLGVCLSFIENLKGTSCTDFHCNYLLCGHFNILAAIYQQKPALISPNIVSFLLKNCLALDSKATNDPLFRKMEHVTEAFKFVNHLLVVTKDPKLVQMIFSTLGPCHRLELQRTNVSWSINNKHEPRQAYRGLLNPGCICYLNSLLQQLFMIDDFRLAVFDINNTNSSKMIEEGDESSIEPENKAPAETVEPSTEILMLQGLKQIFMRLQFSEENNINPTGFARTLKTKEKKPMIKLTEQMDIDEFASILFEKIELGVKEKGGDNFVRGLFGGVYSHQIISKECSHRSEREEEFYSMSLEVKENITKSFESLVKSELLDGGNKYHCQKCNKKVKAQKLQTIKQLPPYLILCLKRFEFDYNIDAKIKINEYCEFPHELNLLPFSQQEIMKNKEDITDETEEKVVFPDSHFGFKLRGVVVHTGSADSGHYYSYIEKDKGNWFEFNDEDVMPFDLDKMPEEAFGSRSSKYDPKIKNAYLLIYERAQLEEKKYDEVAILNRDQHRSLINKITRKNREIWKSELVFSEEYEHTVRRIEINLRSIDCPKDVELAWLRFHLSYYFLVKARKENVQHFMVFSKGIEEQVTNNELFCEMFLRCFSSPKFIEQMFIYNPQRQKCRILGHIFSVALNKYFQNTKDIGFQKNELSNKVLQCLKSMFIMYGPVSELMVSLRKLLQRLSEEGEIEVIYRIILKFNFEQIIFNSVFGVPYDKKTKTENEGYIRNKVNDVELLAPLPFYGKRMHPSNLTESWKIATIMLTLNNMYLEMPENELKEERTFFLSNIYYLKRALCDPNIETKIMSLIIETSSSRGIYYLYLTMKELSFHTKVFASIERALKDYESIKFRPFFLYFEHAINDKDLPMSDKEKIMDIIERSYKQNEKYFLETDSIHQWVLRLISMNESFLELAESRVSFLQEIYDKIVKNPYSSLTDLSKKFKHQASEKYLNRYLGILVSTDIKDYEANSLRMKEEYEQMRNLNYSVKEQYHRPEDHYAVGDKVEIFDIAQGKWRKATIVEYNFGQMAVKKEGKSELLVQLWEDNEKVRQVCQNRLMEVEVTPPESQLSYESESSSQLRH